MPPQTVTVAPPTLLGGMIWFEALKVRSRHTFAPTVNIACPPIVVPGAITYVVESILIEPVVVALAGEKFWTTPQTATLVVADTNEGVHFAIMARLIVKHNVNNVVFIFMEITPGIESDRRLYS
jgi:hypothetical protein